MNVAVRELKDHLSEYLNRASGGEEIVVTSHGKPVARLAPLAAETGEDDALARLRAQPWIRPGKGGKPAGLKNAIRLRGTGPSAADIVLEDRE
jgi:prevent-host-death family protein